MEKKDPIKVDCESIDQLPTEERIRELLEKDEIGILRNLAIERLENEIYDLNAIKLLVRITNGEHKKLILY